MLRCQLNDPKGKEVVAFDFPSNLSELPLNRLVDFLVECRNLDDDDPGTAAAVMAKAVSAFTGIPIHEALQAQSGVYGVEAYQNSLSQIFGRAVKMIGDHKSTLLSPENATFLYMGELYHIPVILQQAIAGEVILPDLNVIEVIEVAEINRFKKQVTELQGDPDGKLRKKIAGMFEEKIKVHGDPGGKLALEAEKMVSSEIEKAGDPDGSLMYTYYLKTLAVLTRKAGEVLPFEDSVREVWIQNRASHFQNIDAATALSVDFFLTSTLAFSEEKPGVVGFLKNQCFALVVGTSLKSAKRLRKPSRTVRRSLKKSGGGK